MRFWGHTGQNKRAETLYDRAVSNDLEHPSGPLCSILPKKEGRMGTDDVLYVCASNAFVVDVLGGFLRPARTGLEARLVLQRIITSTTHTTHWRDRGKTKNNNIAIDVSNCWEDLFAACSAQNDVLSTDRYRVVDRLQEATGC